MKYGIVIPVICRHGMQERSFRSIRQFSRAETPVYVLFQDMEPLPVPEGVTAITLPHFSDECDLWKWALDLAVSQGWDWCLMLHDDFAMREPGWEDDLDQSEGWRVAVASFVTYEQWDEQANTTFASLGHLGVSIDSLSFGFKTSVFSERGCVSALRFGFGFGAWDACAYALEKGYAMWRILLDSDHNWEQRNTREILGVGAPGHPYFRDNFQRRALPSKVLDDQHIQVCGRKICVAPTPDTPQQKRPVRARLNWGAEIKT